MADDHDNPSDRLWQVSYDTYYDAYYQELLRDGVILRWQRIDDPTRVVVALTASGSAVSGWTLWTVSGFRALWGSLAGLAAVLATVHATLNVPGRLKDQADLRRLFAGIRMDLETLRNRMWINPGFDATEKFDKLRDRWAEAWKLRKEDLLLTDGLANKCQDTLHRLLDDQLRQRAKSMGKNGVPPPSSETEAAAPVP